MFVLSAAVVVVDPAVAVAVADVSFTNCSTVFFLVELRSSVAFFR